jgi:hypothetical protein
VASSLERKRPSDRRIEVDTSQPIEQLTKRLLVSNSRGDKSNNRASDTPLSSLQGRLLSELPSIGLSNRLSNRLSAFFSPVKVATNPVALGESDDATDKETVKQPTKRRYFSRESEYESDRQATNKAAPPLKREFLRGKQSNLQICVISEGKAMKQPRERATGHIPGLSAILSGKTTAGSLMRSSLSGRTPVNRLSTSPHYARRDSSKL